MKNNLTFLKIAPAFFLASAMLSAQKTDSTKTKEIEQVVLIGYGKQKKTDLTGSVTSVTSKDFNGGATSAEQLIQGKTPGVSISGNSGAPGVGSTIRIRGGASLTGSNDPLVVIDGVPMDMARNADGSYVSGSPNPLSMVNPNDIESFDILKDASATAIYGNRASNGVILITTKKGTAGKLKVNFNTNVSVSTTEGLVNVLNGDQFRSFVTQASKDYPGIVGQAYVNSLGTANTNWQKLIYQKAWGTDNNLSLQGGIKGLPYRLSIGYTDQNGILRNNSFRRTSADLNINPKFFNNHLAVNFNAKGSFSDNNFSNQGAIGAAIYFDPTQPVYSGNSNYGGYYEWLTNGVLNTNGTANPLGMIAAAHNISSVWRGVTNLQLDYKVHFLPDLHWNVNVGYDYTKSEGSNATSGLYKLGFDNKGSYNQYSQEKKNKLLETYFNYVKDFSGFKVDLLAGYSYQSFENDMPLSTTIYGNGNTPNVTNAYSSKNVLLSFYGRAILSYANRYILTATYRRDGSSRFYDGSGSLHNVWGNFPALAFAWKVNDEAFLKYSQTVSLLKLRLGWGKTGQQQVGGEYPDYARYQWSTTGAQYQFGNDYFYMLRPLVYNPKLTWETTESKNAGIDFGFLHNRITGSVDVYQKDTKNLLAYIPIPAGDLSNYNYLNSGTMRNRGIEGSLTFVPVKSQDFNWEFTVNATHYNPVIKSLSQQISPDYFIPQGSISGGVGSMIQAFTVGYNPYVFQLYQQLYDSNGRPISGAYVDRNGDGKITDADKYYGKSTTPDAILGFSTKFNYKDWDFGFSLRAVLGNYVYNNAASTSTIMSVATNSFMQNVFATEVQNQIVNYNYWSDLYLENASFLKMDNVTLGYNFKDILNKGSNLRVNAMVQNVFTITKYTGVDPEVNGGIDNGFYQRPRIFSLGFNFQF